MKKTILLLAFAVPIFCFGQNEVVQKNDTTSMTNLKNVAISDLKKETSKDVIVSMPDTSPEFEGGQVAMMEYLSKELRYPAEARKKNAQGRVVIQFVIEENGSISAPHVIRRINPLLDEESVRVITNMPKWKPGIHNGKICRSYFTLPISFKLGK